MRTGINASVNDSVVQDVHEEGVEDSDWYQQWKDWQEEIFKIENY